MDALWERLCDVNHLRLAWKRVQERRGKAGVDGISVDAFKYDLESNLIDLAGEIDEESYRPLPALQLTLRERDKDRVIAIFAVRDRVVQQALLLLLQDYFEPDMADSCYGYRLGRSAISAAEKVEEFLRSGKEWFFETDVKDFFDTIDHDLLICDIREKITDEPVIRLIQTCLQGENQNGWSIEPNYLGTSQGSALSPLLSNIYLAPLEPIRNGWRKTWRS